MSIDEILDQHPLPWSEQWRNQRMELCDARGNRVLNLAWLVRELVKRYLDEKRGNK